MENQNDWIVNEIVVHNPTADIAFMAWIDRDGVAENETLLEDEDFFENEDNSDGDLFQAEMQARFEADNGKNFTALELMYKLDEQMKTKNLGNHVFFEGLTQEEANEEGVPCFYLSCGS